MAYDFKEYTSSLDELNVLINTSYANAEGDLRQRTRKVTDDLLSILINAYRLGAKDADSMLESEVQDRFGEEFIEDMYLSIFADIEGKDFTKRVEEHMKNNDLGRLANLTESEFHRVYNQGLCDEAERIELEEDVTVMKVWRTMLDDRVRDTHDYLESTEVGLHEEFVTYTGDSALYPGGFNEAENNVNCRCTVDLSRV